MGKDARTVLSQHIIETFLEISRLSQADLSSGHKYAFEVLTQSYVLQFIPSAQCLFLPSVVFMQILPKSK